jgi:hypothetical protein
VTTEGERPFGHAPRVARAQRIADAQRDVLVAARAWRTTRSGRDRAAEAAAARVLVAAVDWLDALERGG